MPFEVLLKLSNWMESPGTQPRMDIQGGIFIYQQNQGHSTWIFMRFINNGVPFSAYIVLMDASITRMNWLKFIPSLLHVMSCVFSSDNDIHLEEPGDFWICWIYSTKHWEWKVKVNGRALPAANNDLTVGTQNVNPIYSVIIYKLPSGIS